MEPTKEEVEKLQQAMLVFKTRAFIQSNQIY